MGSSSAEFASCLHIPKTTQNNVDLSWLPNYNDQTFTNESHHSTHHITQQDSNDDSWLPNYNLTNTNTSTPAIAPKNSNSIRSPKTNKDSDDSWLPSAPVVRNTIKQNHVHDSKVSNNNRLITSSKSNRSNCYNRKAETGADHSWLPSIPIVNNANKNKETNNNNKNNHLATFSDDHTKDLNKQPSLSSECSVETDSLGGVSTLLRRWKDAETKSSSKKTKAEACGNNNEHKTDESFVDVEKEAVRVGKTRLIRGGQAYIDFLNMVEQDKRRELEGLMKRKAVSKFPNQGRIQAMLRVRFIKIRAEDMKEAKSSKNSVSKTMKSIWDKFSTVVKQDTPASRKVNNNGEGMKKPNTSPECSADCSPVREVIATTATTTAISSQEPVSTTASHQSAQEDTHSEIPLPNTADYQQKSQCLSAKTYSSGIENCHQWINEYSQTDSDWDNEEEDYYGYNWISDIARPRSDWEFMRQKRYQEMLHLQSYNQDIQQLLERKSVSGFLSSDQRNMLDQLMVSRVQHASRAESRKEEEKHEKDEFIDHTACSSPGQRSWNHHRHRRSHHPPYLQNNNNAPQSSIINQPSTEMELIYDLRGHLEQVHHEIMELKKVVTSYFNMQIMNQQQPIQKKRGEQPSPTRNCCVCYTMQANSFLYRCGHMCACYDCGLELQFTTGKCPICEDQILDVVRACAYGD